MGDPTGHFFHDLVEGVVIWEDGAKASSAAPIEVPAESDSLPHADHDHLDSLPHDQLPDVDTHGVYAAQTDATVAATTDHSHDAGTVESVAADLPHDGDANG